MLFCLRIESWHELALAIHFGLADLRRSLVLVVLEQGGIVALRRIPLAELMQFGTVALR